MEEATKSFLYPVFKKEFREKLFQEASNRVAHECARKLETQLLVAPYKPPPDNPYGDEVDEEPQGVKVLACCCGGRDEPTVCVIIDEEGEAQQYLKLSFLDVLRCALFIYRN